MKLELDLSAGGIARVLVIVLIGLALGFALGLSTGPSAVGYAGLESLGPQQLTTADLNRQDIGASIILSRFCEGLGLKSSVYWQSDAQGNVYGVPICLQ